jgi:NAD-dependent deacetylase
MDPLSIVRDKLRHARRITALTGAGVSAASGIPTFRGTDGLWNNFRAEALATPEAFENDPKFVWEWYDWRRGLIANAKPNAAHDVLARWTRERPHFTLITQNVDGLHERAGAERLIRLHGSIWHVRCWDACTTGRTDWRDDRVPLPALPPTCPHCGALVRPGVVWFGEALDPDVVSAATDAAACDVFLTIGTSSVVYPAAGLVHQARRGGAFTVEVNLDATDASATVDIALRGKAEEVLEALNS